jgi:hypothetical protein
MKIYPILHFVVVLRISYSRQCSSFPVSSCKWFSLKIHTVMCQVVCVMKITCSSLGWLDLSALQLQFLLITINTTLLLIYTLLEDQPQEEEEVPEQSTCPLRDSFLGWGVQLRVQLRSANQQTMGAEIHYQKMSSEDTAEEQPLQRAVTKYGLVERDWEGLVLTDLQCGNQH